MDSKEILKAKIEEWKYSDGMATNFALEGELTVTITLGEYRTLLKDAAKASEMQLKAYHAELKVDELREENDQLKAKIESYEKENAEC